MAAVTEPFRAAPPTLADVKDTVEEDVYPHELLEGCETGLVLFCARWYGRQDAFWLAETGITATCVDIDEVRLQGMKGIYPAGWEFVTDDAFQFARDSAGCSWDVVSLDPFTNLFDRCADEIRLWCSLAKRAVILGTGPNTVVKAPEGWEITGGLRRSDYDGGVFWTTLEPV